MQLMLHANCNAFITVLFKLLWTKERERERESRKGRTEAAQVATSPDGVRTI